jgi:putative membrane protein
MLRTRRGSGLLDPVAEHLQHLSADDVEVVVTSSGSLAHIYFARVPERLTLEQISSAYPELIPALVAHDGIGLVLVRSESEGAIVIGKQGIRKLEPDRDRVVEGVDPLGQFSEHAPRFLCQLASYEHSGDIVVNGTFDPKTNRVIGFDDLVRAHGGLGGPQTRPFLLYPTGWAAEPPNLVGAVQIHRFLRRHTTDDDVAITPEHPADARVATEHVARLADDPSDVAEQPVHDVA